MIITVKEFWEMTDEERNAFLVSINYEECLELVKAVFGEGPISFTEEEVKAAAC